MDSHIIFIHFPLFNFWVYLFFIIFCDTYSVLKLLVLCQEFMLLLFFRMFLKKDGEPENQRVYLCCCYYSFEWDFRSFRIEKFSELGTLAKPIYSCLPVTPLIVWFFFFFLFPLYWKWNPGTFYHKPQSWPFLFSFWD